MAPDGISVPASGVAVAKSAPNRGGHAVAAGFILPAAGLLVSVHGTVRYRVICRQLEAGEFAPATVTAIVLSSAVTLLALLAVVVLP
ncbi:DUF202 domain-containing protein [Rhodococcus jostii]|uniref:Putative membrane protein n=1 Tax=Rhodococcus jostii TaxID=132919 RepID=A0A1H4IZ83_RHOJO|nr:DUF202 domain-containing protein [Rhodococcus jostii]SEB38976.1 putative membrane protein [Rhodococcus jostii]